MSKALTVAAVLGATIGLTAPMYGLAEPTPALVEVQAEQQQEIEEAGGEEKISFFTKLKHSGQAALSLAAEKFQGDPDERADELREQIKALQKRLLEAEQKVAMDKAYELPDYQAAWECTDTIRGILEKNKPSFMDRVKTGGE